jgi:hypothetical protein
MLEVAAVEVRKGCGGLEAPVRGSPSLNVLLFFADEAAAKWHYGGMPDVVAVPPRVEHDTASVKRWLGDPHLRGEKCIINERVVGVELLEAAGQARLSALVLR